MPSPRTTAYRARPLFYCSRVRCAQAGALLCASTVGASVTNFRYPVNLPVTEYAIPVKDEPEPEPVRELRVVHEVDQANNTEPVVRARAPP